jgi:hypothetical protein
MKITLRLKSFPDHEGIPGHQGGSLPRGDSGASSERDLVKVDPSTIESNPPGKYWITPQREVYTDNVKIDQSHAQILAHMIASDPKTSAENGVTYDVKSMLDNNTYEDTTLEELAERNNYIKVEVKKISLKHPEKNNSVLINVGELNSSAIKKLQSRVDEGLIPTSYTNDMEKQEFYKFIISGFSGDRAVTINASYLDFSTATGVFIPDSEFDAPTLKQFKKKILKIN